MVRVGPVEDNVPIPPKQSGRPRHPLWELEVGQSRLIEGVAQSAVASKTRDIGRVTGRKFTTRRMEGGVRVWRTA